MIHVPLGEALEFVYGKNLPKKSRSDGDVPVYGSNGITGWNDTALVNEPTVVVGRKGSAGAVHFVEQSCFPIDTTYFVRPRDGYDFDMKFVFYLLRSINLPRLATATGVPGLTREDAYRERISIPTLENQRQIVDLLSRAEGIVRLRREAQRKAAELVPALFLDMFGDPASNPKEWPTTTFGGSISVSSGTFLPAKNMDKSGGFAVYGGNGLSGRHNEYMFESPQIIIGRVGEHCGNVHLTEPNCWITDNALYVREMPELFDRDFLLWHLKIARLNQYASRAGQPLISAGRLASVQMVVPPIHLQRQFSSKADAVRGIATQQTAAMVTAQATFDALLHRSFAVS